MSWSTSSNDCSRSSRSASSGPDAAADARPFCFNSRPSDVVTEGSSSTIRIMASLVV